MKRAAILIATAAILAVAGTIAVNLILNPGVPEPKFPFPTEQISYTYYRPDDGANAVIRSALDEYGKAHPNVKVELKTFSSEEYPQVITTALSFNDPPNLYSFDAAELTGLLNKLAPAPALTYEAGDYLDDFHPSAHPAVVSGALYGVPLRVLPFVLLYDGGQFRKADVSVPSTWVNFVDAAPKIREVEGVDLKKGAIALGTANLLHEPEILSLLMLQNGGSILEADQKKAVFAEPSAGGFRPGAEALKFFGAFADPGKPTYSYNSFQPKVRKAFQEGEIASFIGTEEDEAALSKSGKRPDISRLPQITAEKALSMMKLELEGVHPNAPYKEVAWDILQFLASERIQKKIYKETKIITPHKKVIELSRKDGASRIYLEELEKGRILVKVSTGRYDAMMRRIVTRYFSGENPQFVLDAEQKSFTEYLLTVESGD